MPYILHFRSACQTERDGFVPSGCLCFPSTCCGRTHGTPAFSFLHCTTFCICLIYLDPSPSKAHLSHEKAQSATSRIRELKPGEKHSPMVSGVGRARRGRAHRALSGSRKAGQPSLAKTFIPIPTQTCSGDKLNSCAIFRATASKAWMWQVALNPMFLDLRRTRDILVTPW